MINPNDFGKKTNCTVIDEHGDMTTISLDKLVSDALHAHMPNVHEWLHGTYNEIAKNNPELSRREKGNAVRERALKAEKQTETYKRHMKNLADSL